MRLTRKFMNRNAQFTIIAALLLAVVLTTTMIITYSVIRDTPLRASPRVLGAIDEINFAIKQILGFTVGYYGSVLRVTGNITYARILTDNYLRSGLQYIASIHPDWAPVFQIDEDNSFIELQWYTNESSSFGVITVTYDLPGLGISQVTYSVTCELNATILGVNGDYARVLISKDGGEPLSTLTLENFDFLLYNYNRSMWIPVKSSESPIVHLTSEGAEYSIKIPEEVDPTAFILQVTDHRGIITIASSFTHYTLIFNWNSMYENLTDDNMIIELLQNGTIRWLGQPLNVTGTCMPIPPIPVKSFRVNQTINGISHEVPFQIEEWAADYRVPLGLSNNASLFSNRHMIVFLVNHTVEKVTIWWDPKDTSTQTRFSRTNFYFNDDPNSRILNNGKITLNVQRNWRWKVTATFGDVQTEASFFRVNNEDPVYGSVPALIIYNGVVRDIVTEEAEWSGGIDGCPNVYAEIVIMLPAKTTYYTYLLRMMFVDSLQSRSIWDMSIISVKMSCSRYQWDDDWGQTSAENGTSSGKPIESFVNNETVLFYNYSTATGWMHHWAQFIKEDRGYGIIFPDNSNALLYVFDNKTSGEKYGALKVSDSRQSDNQEIIFEFSPVAMNSVSFQTAKDITWRGAIVLFNLSDPVYNSDDETGLWVMVEYPPSITISYES